MKYEFIQVRRCPQSGKPPLQWAREDGTGNDGGQEGWLVSEDSQHRYPARGGIPRFVPASNYADNFGMQWYRFAKIQLESHSGYSISADRFWMVTGWKPAKMQGKLEEVEVLKTAHLVAQGRKPSQ